MSNVRQIDIKKSELAMYKGLGQTNAQLAKRYGVSASEMMDTQIMLGMIKGKTLKKDYIINPINDVEELVEETNGLDPDMSTETEDNTEAVEYEVEEV